MEKTDIIRAHAMFVEPRHLIKQVKVRLSFIKNFTYIIVDKASKQAAIVDPAWELGTVLTALDELDAKLTAILLTHSHYDHVNMVKPLLKRFSPQVYMSTEEIEFYKFTCERLNPVQHRDIIPLGHTPITCISTPGHTAGGLCFLLSDSLFTGDTVFIEGCGICYGKGGSPEEMFDTIQMIKLIVPPHVRVYPGHSFGKTPGSPLSALFKENIYFQIDQKKHFVDFRMRKDQKNLFNFQ